MPYTYEKLPYKEYIYQTKKIMALNGTKIGTMVDRMAKMEYKEVEMEIAIAERVTGRAVTRNHLTIMKDIRERKNEDS